MNNLFERKATVYSIDGTMRVETSVKLINRAAEDLRMPRGKRREDRLYRLAGAWLLFTCAVFVCVEAVHLFRTVFP